jgi:hypothetical protein
MLTQTGEQKEWKSQATTLCSKGADRGLEERDHKKQSTGARLLRVLRQHCVALRAFQCQSPLFARKTKKRLFVLFFLLTVCAKKSALVGGRSSRGVI